MFGYLLGTIAVAWGVMVAVIDQPTASGRNLSRLCTALMTGCAVFAIAAGVAAAVHW
jgi:hypothetical protein